MSGEMGMGGPQEACWVGQWNEHELRPCPVPPAHSEDFLYRGEVRAPSPQEQLSGTLCSSQNSRASLEIPRDLRRRPSGSEESLKMT